MGDGKGVFDNVVYDYDILIYLLLRIGKILIEGGLFA